MVMEVRSSRSQTSSGPLTNRRMKAQNGMSRYLPLLAFWFLGIVWGINFIFMKWATEWLSPSQVVFWRLLFGLIPVVLYARVSNALKWSHFRYAGHFLVMAFLATVVVYYCYAKASALLHSGVAGALSGAIPLFAFTIGAVFLAEEKVTKTRLVGVIIGYIGVVIIAQPFDADVSAGNLEGAIYMAIGSLGHGAAFVYARKYLSCRDIAPAALTAYQLAIGLLILSVVTDYGGMADVFQDPRASVGLVIGLGLLGTGAAFIAYYFIVERLGAISASSVTYIPPVVALLVGAFLVEEDIEPSSYFATILILAGVFLLRRNANQT